MLRRAGLDDGERVARRAVATVFPFRTNDYVVNELIDWSAGTADPIFRLTFPDPGMLAPADLARMERLLRAEATPAEVGSAANEIRSRLNPHPAGQIELNEPTLGGRQLAGLQHKYPETLLVFPRQGQTCHAYCQYCFRWPQFVGIPELKIAIDDVSAMQAYLRAHPEVTDVLLTGGDPLIMATDVLRRYVEPLLRIDTVRSIRIGTKALSYWPYRFLTEPDGDDLLQLFRAVRTAGKHLAVMAHFSHPQELMPPAVGAAVARIWEAGALIRCQSPIIRQVNDDAATWARLWRGLVTAGMVPYYMFVERDTGAAQHFGIPLVRAYEIFREAHSSVSGLARTVRGPVMSAAPGKVCVDGIAEVAGESVFVLRYLQARDPALVDRPFFAHADPSAIWLTDLKPALGATELGPR